MVKLSNNFGENFLVYIYSNAEWKIYKFLIFKVIKVGFQVNIQLSKLMRSRKKDTQKKKYKPYMAKKTIYPGTQGRKNKILKMPNDLTGINKIPIVG